ncbi:MAG: TlpA disulfide reductase family protein [Ferruginibacter sp.]
MKKYILLSLVSFLCIILYAQPKDSVKLPHPFALLSPQQQKEVLFIKSLSDYSYIEGRQFGTFCATDTTGKIILTNDNLMGKLVFINFWFDGCAYCHTLFEPLNKLTKHYKDNPRFQVLSFTFDPPQILEKNITKYGLEYPVFILSQGDCARLLIDKGYPANFLLDKTGKIVLGTGVSKFLANPKFFDEEIIPRIDSLLKQN